MVGVVSEIGLFLSLSCFGLCNYSLGDHMILPPTCEALQETCRWSTPQTTPPTQLDFVRVLDEDVVPASSVQLRPFPSFHAFLYSHSTTFPFFPFVGLIIIIIYPDPPGNSRIPYRLCDGATIRRKGTAGNRAVIAPPARLKHRCRPGHRSPSQAVYPAYSDQAADESCRSPASR